MFMNMNLIPTNNKSQRCSYCKLTGHRVNKCNSDDINAFEMFVLDRKMSIDNTYGNLSVDVRKIMISDWLSQKYSENEILFEAYAAKCFKIAKKYKIQDKIYCITNKLYDNEIGFQTIINDNEIEIINDYMPPIENHIAGGEPIPQQILNYQTQTSSEIIHETETNDINQIISQESIEIINDKKKRTIVKITCDICYEEKGKKNFKQLKKCKHTFCIICIHKLIDANHSICPICREPFNYSHCKSLR